MSFCRALASLAIAAVALGAVACSNDASVAFSTRTTFDLSTDALSLPPGSRMDTPPSGAVLASVPCGPMGMCPSATGSDPVAFECVGGVCDPSPKTISIPVGDIVDLDVAAGDLRDVLAQAERVEIRRVAYDVKANTLTIDLPAVDIFWGPEAASAVDEAMGVRPLGTLPAVTARTTGSGEMAIDIAGRDALSTYIVTSSTKRIRFFARTQIDLAPGGAYPEGAANIEVTMEVAASGRIIR